MYTNFENFLNESTFKNCIKNINGDCVKFVHKSKYDFTEFKTTKYINKASKYTFFSNDIPMFVSGNYIYHALIQIDNKDVFNIFNLSPEEIKIESSYLRYKKEIDSLLENNLEFFYNVWIKSNVDSPEEVESHYSKKLSKFELLRLFITEWNDNWCIIETDIFIDFLESKAYKAFLTMEEGHINIAIKDKSKIKLINKNSNF